MLTAAIGVMVVGALNGLYRGALAVQRWRGVRGSQR
jgi:hypothetical protein